MCAAPLLMVTGLAGGRSLYIFRWYHVLSFHSNRQCRIYTILCIYPYRTGSFTNCLDKPLRGNSGYCCIAAFIAEISVVSDLFVLFYFFYCDLCCFPFFRVIFETFFLFPILVTETDLAIPYLLPCVITCMEADVSVTTFLPSTILYAFTIYL